NCLMIEPTETETIEVLDKFAETMLKIYDEMKNAPDLLKNSPTKTPIKRVDDITAARQPILKYDFQ
ncbi:MAG TPA: aminomethyl-transferring glycine dehydrogenase subunit GcvPB, partial [Spirochaetota bacterium]|nr:aminomethyl-transferring glycine dehydrogenase subunit GcvPB [Spirochaetota bacterium]